MLSPRNIVHGREFTAPDRFCEPVSYYAPQSGIGLAMQKWLSGDRSMSAVIGLGAGAIAAMAPGRRVPFLRNQSAGAGFGDGSLPLFIMPRTVQHRAWRCAALARTRAAQKFDVLALDAFTSDAIPVHLLTTEAFRLYWRHSSRMAFWLSMSEPLRRSRPHRCACARMDELEKFSARLITNVWR